MAPQSPSYDRQPTPMPPAGAAIPAPGQGGYGALPPYEPQLQTDRLRTGQSGPYYPPYERGGALPPTLDIVTITLAILAFFAVACLLPLYIAVYQAYF
jgi:hypothetical protein